jgi:hypothetical protein
MSQTATITPVGDSLALRTPYDPALVDAFKATVPGHARRWDKGGRQWLFATAYLPQVEQLCQNYGLPIYRTGNVAAAAAPTTRILRVEYIGAPKERQNGEVTAFGYAEGDWSVVFPQAVLKAWFLGQDAAQSAPADLTYYGLLGVKREATAEEIKRAHRVAVKRWHPDINRDADAPEMMKRINVAYAILAEPKLRLKYDAGLALEATVGQQQRPADPFATAMHWRPPLRCGWIMAEGIESLGRVIVSRICQWQDITDSAGRVMVTSWPAGRDMFITEWI